MKGFAVKIWITILIVTIFAGLISGCSNILESTTRAITTPAVTSAPVTTNPAKTTPALTVTTTPFEPTMTVTDDYSRTVTIKKFPKRIISLSPANTEILFALGLNDRIVGVSDYSDYPEAAKSKQSVGAYDTPNIEQIVALEPDLVLATEEHQAEIEQLESKDITVIAVNPKTVADVLKTISFIGKITGMEITAAKVVADIQTRIDAVTAKTAALTDGQRPRVFVVIWHDPIWTVGSGTFHDELIKMAGGVNMAGNLSGYVSIDLEAVIAGNPQVIIAGVGMGEGDTLSLDAMQNDDRLSGTDARMNKRVYGANMDIVSRPGPRLADALEIFFQLIHPELQ